MKNVNYKGSPNQFHEVSNNVQRIYLNIVGMFFNGFIKNAMLSVMLALKRLTWDK